MKGKQADKNSRVSRVRQRYLGHRQLAVFGFGSLNRYKNPPFLSDNEEWRLANIAEYGVDLVHLPTSKCLTSFNGSSCAVDLRIDLPCSPDGEWMALPNAEVSFVNVFRNRDQSDERDLLGLEGCITSIAFSPDNTQVAAASEKGDIAPQWMIESGEPLSVWHGHAGGKTVLCYDRDGRQILSGGADGSIRLFDARSGDVMTVIHPRDKTPVISLSMNKYGSLFLATASDNHARLWSSNGILMDNVEGPFSTLSHVYLDAIGRYAFLQDDWHGAGLFELEWR